jgi:hypothetical protein
VGSYFDFGCPVGLEIYGGSKRESGVFANPK